MEGASLLLQFSPIVNGLYATAATILHFKYDHTLL